MKGKGIWINIIRRCEDGDTNKIAVMAKNANFDHVVIRVVTGVYGYNIHNGEDLAANLASRLIDKGIEVWGYVDPYPKVSLGHQIERTERRFEEEIPGLSGVVVDAEGAWKEYHSMAGQYMDMLTRWGVEMDYPIGITTFRYPSYHPDFPFEEFHRLSDFTAPQVYWERAHNPGEQLARTIKEYAALGYGPQDMPFYPIGSAYHNTYDDHPFWTATPEDLKTFWTAVKGLGLPGASFWDWQHSRIQRPDFQLWNTLCDLKWKEEEPPVEPSPNARIEGMKQAYRDVISHAQEKLDYLNLHF